MLSNLPASSLFMPCSQFVLSRKTKKKEREGKKHCIDLYRGVEFFSSLKIYFGAQLLFVESKHLTNVIRIIKKLLLMAALTTAFLLKKLEKILLIRTSSETTYI